MAEQLSDPQSDPRSLSRFRAAVELARALPFPVNLWQVQNLFYDQLRGPVRKSRAGAEHASSAALNSAGDLAKLGETLLFTPEALHLVSHSPAAD
jgi:hypothetical protein